MQAEENNFAETLPASLLEAYDPLECLAHSDHSETLLVKCRKTGEYLVAKLRKKNSDAENERELLSRLDHPAIPKVAGYIETDDCSILLREYVDGISLEEENVPISARRTAEIAADICGVLTYLHNLPTPVIHRDIKPKNIILGDDGKIYLIDFCISREYSVTAKKDTAFLGTEDYSPPEQYGFKQTDARADIFSLGMLMCYLATGKCDLDALDGIQSKKFVRVVRKCTAFSPEKRFATSEAVRKALSGVDSNSARTKIITAALLGVVVGFAAGWIAKPMFPKIAEQQASAVTFKEPLIEDAVRLSLGKQKNEPIYPQELDRITHIFIWGEHVVSTDEEYTAFYDRNAISYGSLESLEDTLMFRNLTMLKLLGQPLSDITPLSHLTRLEHLEIHYCNVSDFSCLAGLPRLRGLHIDDLLTEDLSFISKIPNLRNLGMNGMLIKSLEDIGEIPYLEEINLNGTQLSNLDGIAAFTGLIKLDICNTDVTDFSALTAMPNLKTLVISRDMEQYIETIGETDIELVVL
jgi:serine/threonine protein kinase